MSIASERAERLAHEPLRDMHPATGLVRGARTSLREIWSHRELLDLLVRREIKSRYKDSTLGLVWSLIRPLVQLLIYYVAIGRILGAERSIPSFAIFVYTGLTAWALFSEIVASGTGSIVANSGIIKKIHLPREIFPLASVGSALFNFCVQFLILIVAAVITDGIPINGALLRLPLSIAVIVVWGTALALVLGACNVYLRDVQYLVEVGLLIGFWLSPIVYSFAMVKDIAVAWVAELYISNPITLAILGMQRVIWTAGSDVVYPSHLTWRMLLALGVGCVALVVAQRLFDRLQRNFAQEI